MPILRVILPHTNNNALTHFEPAQLEKETRRYLPHLLINEADQLQAPLFGRWIRDKDEMV